MNKRKKKWPWIVLIIIFSVIMILDIIALVISSKVPSGFDGKGFKRLDGDHDFASVTDGMPEIPQGKDGEKLEFPGSSDGEKPEFPSGKDGESFDFPGSGDGERPEFPSGSDDSGNRPQMPSGTDGENFSFPTDNNGSFPGAPNGSSNIFAKLKKVFIIVLIICICVDIFAVIMLMRAVLYNKRIDNDDNGGDDNNGGGGSRVNPDDVNVDQSQAAYTGSQGGFNPAVATESAEVSEITDEAVYDEQDSFHEKSEKKRRVGRAFALIVPAMMLAVIIFLSVLSSKKKADTSSVTAEETVIETALKSESMSSVINAGGSVTSETSENQYFPEGVDILSYKVSEGDIVSEGDVVAEVDKTSVISTIKEIQSVIAELDEELEEISDDASEKMTSGADGRIKKIYASSGESVVDVVRENEALMLISIDGKMAVDIETDNDYVIGDTVSVQLSDEVVDGRISRIKEGSVTVTIDDEYGEYGENVNVSVDDKEIGSGPLYINSALAVTGYEGIIDEIKVEEGDKISEGDTLLSLTEGVYSARYESLLKQRNKLEEQMKTLFELYQSGEITAIRDGEIVEVEAALTEVGYKAGRVKTEKLSNSPTGEDDSALDNFIILVTGAGENELQIKMTANPIGEVDFLTVGMLDTSACANAQTISRSEIGRVFGYDGVQWIQQSSADIQVGDVMIASFDSSGNLMWMARRITASQPGQQEVSTETTTETITETITEATTEIVPENTTETASDKSSEAASEPTTTPDQQTTPSGSEGDKTAVPTGYPDAQSGKNDQTAGNNNSDIPAGAVQSEKNSGNNSKSAGNSAETPDYTSGVTGSASYSGVYTSVEEAESEEEKVYAVAEVSVYSIAPRNKVEITLTIDELDITSIYIGQTCEITFDAISAKSFEGKVTEIDMTGENSGGNTKYTVTVTLDREDDMLSGMNTHITFSTETRDDVKVIPESAIIEKGDKCYVYTEYNKEEDELSGLKEISLGVADGENVEVISGLDENDKIYYRYADSLTYTFIND